MCRVVAAIVLASIGSLLSAQGSLIVNGSFEAGPGRQMTVSSPSTAIAGWTVHVGNVDYLDAFWVAAHGSWSLDLDGTVPGGVSQTVTTIPDSAYLLTFDMAGNPDTPGIKRLVVRAAGQSESFSFDSTGRSAASMGWTRMTMIFVASDATTTIEFVSLSAPESGRGAALDNVALVEARGSAYFTSFGAACSGTAGLPRLFRNQLPRVGQPFSVALENLPTNQACISLVGFSRRGWGSVVLPLPLDAVGMAGCTLHTAVDVPPVTFSTGPFGAPVWGFAVPYDAALVGLVFFVQCLVTDPAANAAGLIATNAGLAAIGT